MYQLALRSREHWLEILTRAHLPYWPDGSIHAVYRDDEVAVAEEFAELAPGLGFQCCWFNAEQIRERSAAVNTEGLRGGLWSPTEVMVDPWPTIAALPEFLHEQLGVEFRFNCSVHDIDLPCLRAGGEQWRADRAIVCSGEDFESLYPQVYAGSGLTRVKLQMLRTVPQPGHWRLGPALAAGLTLRFYSSFAVCSTLGSLKQRIAEEMPDYDRWEIHGLVSQTTQGELTVGDSHEYGLAVDIFNKEEVDRLILRYISSFLAAPRISRLPSGGSEST
jgi:D-hydroxyproline dehydrogenase subunit beta